MLSSKIFNEAIMRIKLNFPKHECWNQELVFENKKMGFVLILYQSLKEWPEWIFLKTVNHFFRETYKLWENESLLAMLSNIRKENERKWREEAILKKEGFVIDTDPRLYCGDRDLDLLPHTEELLKDIG